MIINFSIENFGSVKGRQTLSFEADSSEHLEDYYVIKSGKFRLLKLALIYGANAAGKTTILRALQFLRELVLEPEEKKNHELDFSPFLFDPLTPQQNSILAIEFIQNDVKYSYEVEFYKKAIVSEKLDFYDPNKASVFSRVTDIENQYTEITFGSKIKKEKAFDKTFGKILEANTLWNNTVLGGFLKTNIEIYELKEASDWFSNYLRALIFTHTDLSGYVTSRIHKDEVPKDRVVNILKRADFNISDILIQEEEKDIPDGFLDFIERQLNVSDEKVSELKSKGKVTSINIEFEHTVGGEKYSLLLDQESQGTKRYYGFAGLLILLLKNSVAFPIDELESSLHPELYMHFLLSFLINSKNSQIIATTHNREILSNKDVFRNDAIWFVDKPDGCSTELYSLADFDTSVIRDSTNVLNAYKSGKLRGVPNLGDYFIDMES